MSSAAAATRASCGGSRVDGVLGGHGELEARMASAHDQFLAPGEFIFGTATTSNASATRSSSTGRWSPPAGGDAVGVGLEFLILAPDGRMRLDYQFIEL